MTRLFLSLYLFITLSLVTLTLGLEQVVQLDEPTLSTYQQAWLSQLNASQRNSQQLQRRLRDANIPYSIFDRRDLAASASLSEQLEREQLVQGFYGEHWQVYVPLPDAQVLLARFDVPPAKPSNWWLVSSLFFILLGVVIAIWIYPLWRDLRKLVGATEKLNDDGSLALPSLSRRSPLITIVQALQGLSDNVARLLRQQQELAGAVTHEFKTPLARLKFALAGDKGITAQQTQEARRDIDELDTLVQEMLDFTRMNARQPDLYIECIPLHDFCRERARQCLHAPDQHIHVKGDNPTLNADAHFLAQAMDNLLNNAVRHAHEHILVTIDRADEALYVHVDDDGSGIDDAHKKAVFDPFYRQDSARSRTSGGAGLGLAIVARVAGWHDAACSVTDSPLGGARFTLRFTLGQTQD